METDFESVWSRVTAAGRQDPPEVQLCSFLRNEAEDARILLRLSVLVCDACVRQRLCELRMEKLRRLQRLRAALYLLTGESECPAAQPEAAEKPEPLAALRLLYDRSSNEASAYRRASAICGRAELKALYSSLAEAEARHGRTLLECTERLLNLTCRTART